MDIDTFRKRSDEIEIDLDTRFDEMIVMSAQIGDTKEIKLGLRSKIQGLKVAMNKMLFELHRDV